MDAVKFVEEVRRRYKETGERPFLLHYLIPSSDIVKEVEEWSAAHPIKTRQSVFLEQYPNADLCEDGVLKVCPKVVEGSSYENSRNCGIIPCEECHKNYWMKVVEK